MVISSAPAAKLMRAKWRRSVVMMFSRWLTEMGAARC
jgi:hypothetical protein